MIGHIMHIYSLGGSIVPHSYRSSHTRAVGLGRLPSMQPFNDDILSIFSLRLLIILFMRIILNPIYESNVLCIRKYERRIGGQGGQDRFKHARNLCNE